MRTNLSTVALIFSSGLMAQCAHDPVITPNNLQLCPSDTALLSTQPGDAYQWYRNQTLIPGATDQTLQVIGASDAGSNFEVHVVLDSCLEFSSLVLVDGYAWQQPQVFWSGNAVFSDTAGLHFCDGTSAILILQPPHDTNIIWLNNGNIISGATDDSLVVTTDGNYRVVASIAACPGTTDTLSGPFSVLFEPYVQPTILWDDTLLCADPPGNSYQWYINNIPVFGGSNQCILASFIGGSYTVDVDYGSPCEQISDPLVVIGMEEVAGSEQLTVWPNPATDVLNIASSAGTPLGAWSLVDMLGKELRNGTTAVGSAAIPLYGLVPGYYFLRVEGHRSAAFVVM